MGFWQRKCINEWKSIESSNLLENWSSEPAFAKYFPPLALAALLPSSFTATPQSMQTQIISLNCLIISKNQGHWKQWKAYLYVRWLTTKVFENYHGRSYEAWKPGPMIVHDQVNWKKIITMINTSLESSSRYPIELAENVHFLQFVYFRQAVHRVDLSENWNYPKIPHRAPLIDLKRVNIEPLAAIFNQYELSLPLLPLYKPH